MAIEASRQFIDEGNGAVRLVITARGKRYDREIYANRESAELAAKEFLNENEPRWRNG